MKCLRSLFDSSPLSAGLSVGVGQEPWLVTWLCDGLIDLSLRRDTASDSGIKETLLQAQAMERNPKYVWNYRKPCAAICGVVILRAGRSSRV